MISLRFLFIFLQFCEQDGGGLFVILEARATCMIGVGEENQVIVADRLVKQPFIRLVARFLRNKHIGTHMEQGHIGYIVDRLLICADDTEKLFRRGDALLLVAEGAYSSVNNGCNPSSPDGVPVPSWPSDYEPSHQPSRPRHQ